MQHVADVRFHCRWRWTHGDLAIWDERSTNHRSAADHWPQARSIRRIEVDGDRPYFDPDAVREMASTAAGDLTIGGSLLAAQAFAEGLVDECQLLVYPVLLGAGKSAFPRDTRVRLDLLEQHVFDNGVVNLHYRVRH